MTDTRAGGARASFARALILAGALAGLFAMHGLSDHGTAHPVSGPAGAHARAAMTDAATGLGALKHSGTGAHVVASTHDTASAITSSAATGAAHAANATGDAGATVLCFAVLASAFVALARLLASGELLPWFEGVAATGVALVATGRERDPPSLVALSIRRC